MMHNRQRVGEFEQLETPQQLLMYANNKNVDTAKPVLRSHI